MTAYGVINSGLDPSSPTVMTPAAIAKPVCSSGANGLVSVRVLVRVFIGIVVAAAVASTTGCSTAPKNTDRVASTAIVDDGSTVLQRVAAASLPSVRSKADGAYGDETSGFQLISAGEEAFATLYTLITRAERSLDLQYYIVRDDPYARTLLRAAREAAGRGVRVRLLIDDFYTTGLDDRIAWYAAHPNIEVRVFNPFFGGRRLFATRLLASITDIDRINRRMHNKLFVADNAFAVTGGRNVGAEYYQHSDRTNFLDLDMLAAGPIVKDLSDTFDRYWNSGLAYPIDDFSKADATLDTVDRRALTDPADPVVAATGEARELGMRLARKIDSGRLPLDLSPAELIADRPSKIRRTRPKLGPDGLISGETIASDVLSIVRGAKSDVVIVSPYFVPGERGTEALRTLVRAGVHVRVLTNSLAATDAAIVHIGYSRYRKALIEAGVDIWELRPDPGEDGVKLSALGSSKASLHAKALVVDRGTLFVGSFNVDQRSSFENTEMGLEIDSAALCEQVLGVLSDRGPQSAYRVTLARDGSLQWTTTTDGVVQVFHDEPGASTALKLTLRLLAPFAPEQTL